ncbi:MULTISPECIES: ABC transporter permease [unclassified Mycoplasma]|uniref:ABC transporter permease n=1 Tax=unclassified Mycoplasma TaxID=2683645 RepID=UPI00211B8DF9|nr:MULTISPECIES: ABC transporter permease subunit [unclassified Mycoplasma]UUM19626.1 ABC transporter permease subunit [Mycoplasma sp. 1578d]UUM24595.1 ABC transporter permease subunit [Mycoplasma sp. 3686d]
MHKKFSFVSFDNSNIDQLGQMQQTNHSLIKKFFKNKLNLSLIILLAGLLLIIWITNLSYQSSSYTPMHDSFLTYNLPSSLSPITTRTFDKGSFTDYLFKLQAQGTITLDRIKNFQSTYTLTYNPYQLIQAITNQKLFYLLGTNQNGVDNLAILLNSFSLTFLILIISTLIQGVLGIYIGTTLGYFYQGKTSKVSFWAISVFMIIPFLFLNIIIFNLTGYSFTKAILILGLIGFFSIFYFAYNNAVLVVQKQYILAYRVLGLSSWKIIYRIVKVNFFTCLPLLAEQLSLGLIALASLSFFNIKDIYQYSNIGNLYKQIIDNPSNISLFVCTFIISILFIILLKLIASKIAHNFWNR